MYLKDRRELIFQLSHTQKVGHIGVSPDETGTSSDNFDTYSE